MKKQYLPPFAEFFYYNTEDCLNGSKPRENSSVKIDDFDDFDPSEWEKLY